MTTGFFDLMDCLFDAILMDIAKSGNGDILHTGDQLGKSAPPPPKADKSDSYSLHSTLPLATEDPYRNIELSCDFLQDSPMRQDNRCSPPCKCYGYIVTLPMRPAFPLIRSPKNHLYKLKTLR